MKRALVLAGGGGRGAYQIGMLRELVQRQGLDFQIIRGVSVGALNASFLAQAESAENSWENLRRQVDELHYIWTREIKGNGSVYEDRGLVGLAAMAVGGDSLYNLEPLRRLIYKHLNVEKLKNSGRDFKVGAVSLVSGRYKEWQPLDEDFIERIIASSSIPVVFPFVDFEKEREVLIDGGVRNMTPLASAFEARADEIYVLLTSPIGREGEGLRKSNVQMQDYRSWKDNRLGTKVSGLDVLKRTVDVLSDEIYLNDLEGALAWNEVALRIQELAEAAAGRSDLAPQMIDRVAQVVASLQKAGKRHVPIFVLAPQEWYGKDNAATDFSPQLIQRAIEHGEEVAREQKRWLWPFNPKPVARVEYLQQSFA